VKLKTDNVGEILSQLLWPLVRVKQVLVIRVPVIVELANGELSVLHQKTSVPEDAQKARNRQAVFLEPLFFPMQLDLKQHVCHRLALQEQFDVNGLTIADVPLTCNLVVNTVDYSQSPKILVPL
jgi:hypothetical protein